MGVAGVDGVRRAVFIWSAPVPTTAAAADGDGKRYRTHLSAVQARALRRRGRAKRSHVERAATNPPRGTLKDTSPTPRAAAHGAKAACVEF